MMRYQVFEMDTPAQYPDFMVDESWSNSIFDKWEDAVDYANNWLGIYGGKVFQPNIPIDYSGYGDIIVIRTIQ